MNIQILGEDLNRIMRACAPVVDAQNLRESMRYIEIQHDGEGNGCATALDGYVLAQITFPCQGDAGKMLISPCGKVEKDAEIELVKHGEHTTIKVGDVQRTEKTPSAGEYINHQRLTQEAVSHPKAITISVNTNRLKQIIRSHKAADNMITLHIYAPEAPVVVQSQDVMGMMCPVLHADGNMEPKFWEKDCREVEDNDAMDATQGGQHR